MRHNLRRIEHPLDYRYRIVGISCQMWIKRMSRTSRKTMLPLLAWLHSWCNIVLLSYNSLREQLVSHPPPRITLPLGAV